tara:strand:+ start:994 stop:1587 length:594 start_codon:yes stop_codon:yes gene_type:complete
MNFINFLLFFCLFKEINTLKPPKLPSGKDKKFYFNKSKRNEDLKIISPANVNLLTKHWLNNILSCSKEIYPEDKYIVQQIDLINEYIKSYTKKLYTNTNNDNVKNINIAWCPKGYYKEIIFIVIGEILLQERILLIKYVIHSPFWDTSQIDSVNLKYALEDLINDIDDLQLDLSYIYENDERYKLFWLDWESKYNNL